MDEATVSGGYMDSTLEEKIKTKLVNNKLPCAAAFQIAKEMNVSPHEVGEAANRLKIKIGRCQLGCFP